MNYSAKKNQSLFVLLPGITQRQWRFGGMLIALKMSELLRQHLPAQAVTYKDREKDFAYLDDILDSCNPEDIFVITWGPHVGELVKRLHGRRIVYYAQSTGWQIQLPISVPVICLSKYIMATWMQQTPYNPLFLLGPVLESDCSNYGLERDIDILFLERKSTQYLKDSLVPALREKCNVFTVNHFISRQELFKLYNRSRVYLYSSAPWDSGWVEGFGFQPLEAIICGCIVFSNLHGGLSDYLDPEINAFKIENYSAQYDVERILAKVKNYSKEKMSTSESLHEFYSEEAFHDRIRKILPALNDFFSHLNSDSSDVYQLAVSRKVSAWRTWFYKKRKAIQRWVKDRGKSL